ncbi:MAG: 16S rRNA (guanine(527)-N(7))-methyltransferase RsmG [Flavobacteriales bacterium]
MQDLILLKHFPKLSAHQQTQFKQLQGLYNEWNAQINVISRKDISELYIRHVLHSLGIAKVMKFSDGSKVLDVGTGGGFPGIPLAILYPNVNFVLVDSIGKKIKVVKEVASALGLTNIEAQHTRAEEIKDEFDFVVSRAVTKLPKFVNWVRPKIKKKQINPWPNGILYLKGGDLKDEIDNTQATCEVIQLKEFFDEEFFETKAVVYVKLS